MNQEQLSFGKKTERIAWIFLIPVLCLLFFSHTYNDILVTARQGIQFWDILFQGRFFDFYSEDFLIASDNIYYTVEQGCAYNILVYLCFAIWNIPLAVLMKLTSLDVMNNIFCLAWIKGMLVVAMLFAARVMTEILRELKLSRERIHFAWYLFFSSAIVISSLFVNSQYDILGLVFQLLGVLYFLRKDEKRFLLFFGVAICFKVFALILIVPLLLLRKKRITQLAGNLLLAALPYLLTTGLFWFGSGKADSGSFLAQMVAMLFSSNNGGINYFVLTYGALLVWCYRKAEEESASVQTTLWICFAAMTSFFAFCDTYPYWKILIAPYWVMLIATAPVEEMDINVLLEGIGLPALVVSQMTLYYWCFWGNTMKPMLFGILTPDRVLNRANQLETLFTTHTALIHTISKSTFLIAAICVAYINFPKIRKDPGKGQLHADVLIFRFAVVAAVGMLPILSLFI